MLLHLYLNEVRYIFILLTGGKKKSGSSESLNTSDLYQEMEQTRSSVDRLDHQVALLTQDVGCLTRDVKQILRLLQSTPSTATTTPGTVTPADSLSSTPGSASKDAHFSFPMTMPERSRRRLVHRDSTASAPATSSPTPPLSGILKRPNTNNSHPPPAYDPHQSPGSAHRLEHINDALTNPRLMSGATDSDSMGSPHTIKKTSFADDYLQNIPYADEMDDLEYGGRVPHGEHTPPSLTNDPHVEGQLSEIASSDLHPPHHHTHHPHHAPSSSHSDHHLPHSLHPQHPAAYHRPISEIDFSSSHILSTDL